MWEKQLARALTPKPESIPETTLEKLALDAATADAFAQLCGAEPAPMEVTLRVFAEEHEMPNPDIVASAYRAHHQRLIARHLQTRFLPGECWQRRQDQADFIQALRDGRDPDYQSFEPWQ